MKSFSMKPEPVALKLALCFKDPQTTARVMEFYRRVKTIHPPELFREIDV